MKQNVVFITAVNYPEKINYAEFSFYTWQQWCEKNDTLLFTWDVKKEKSDTMRPTWMRYKMFDILDRQGIDFDQVAMVDADTMVRWDCPDFFKITDGKFCAVHDSRRCMWVRKSIRVYRHLFPGVTLDYRDYFNAGFVIVNQKHRTLFNDMLDLYLSGEAHIRALIRNLKMGSDQTPLNYMVAQKGYEKNYLPKEYNYMHFIPFVFNNDFLVEHCPIKSFIKKGYILHFTGINKSLNKRIMARTWAAMKENGMVE